MIFFKFLAYSVSLVISFLAAYLAASILWGIDFDLVWDTTHAARRLG